MQKKKIKRVMASVLLAGVVGLSLTGCAGTERWKEEVQLSDNRVVVIDRETLREGGGGEISSNPSGSKPKEHRIHFANPDEPGKLIDWRTTKKSPATWPEVPLIFDLESGRPIVYTVVYVSSVCGVYSKYTYRDGLWNEEALPQKFPERTTNLYLGIGVKMPKFINLEMKNNENNSLGYSKLLKQIGPTPKVCVKD
jgi:hypothetical protein